MRTAAGRRRAGTSRALGVSVRRARTWAKTVAGAKRHSAGPSAFMRLLYVPGLDCFGLSGTGHHEKNTRRNHAETRLALMLPRFADFNEIKKQGAGGERPQIAAHMDIGFHPAGSGFFKPYRMLATRFDPIPNIGRKSQNLLRPVLRDHHLHGQKRRVLDCYGNFLDGRDENIALRVLAQNGREEPHQGGPGDRGAAVKPGPVAGNLHVDATAKRRIPLLHGRQGPGQAFDIQLRAAVDLPSRLGKKLFGHNLRPIPWVYRKVLMQRLAPYRAIIERKSLRGARDEVSLMQQAKRPIY